MSTVSEYIKNLNQNPPINVVDFTTVPTAAIKIKNLTNIDSKALEEIEQRYTKNGFSIIDLQTQATENTVLRLSSLLNLGRVFVPSLYRKGQQYQSNSSGIATIKSSGQENNSHSSFCSEGGIELHCDGTLQQIGYIQTTILACKDTASKGGESVLFNATGAYHKLLQLDQEAALSMASHSSLVRHANLNDCSDRNVGPVFAIKDNELVCAYSVTKTDSFIASHDVSIEALKRAIRFMKKASSSDSRYTYVNKLKSGQVIVFANNKIAHGRLPYDNLADSSRCMFRGLFLRKVTLKNNDLINNLTKKENIMTKKQMNSLLAWWKFSKDSDNLYQETYNSANNLEFQGGTPKTVKGPVDKCAGVKLDGYSQWLSTQETVLDTEDSYSVAAWVRIDSDALGGKLKFKEGEHAFTAVSQDSLTHSAFYLGVRSVETEESPGLLSQTMRWNFTVAPIDGSETGPVEWQHAHSSELLDDSILDKWVLLVGVCNVQDRTLSIYVANENDSNTVSMPDDFILLSTDRGVQIGKGKWLTRNVDFWPGSIGPLRLFSKALTKDEIQTLAKT